MGCDNRPVLHLPELLPVVLVHGGLHDDPPMTGERFWGASGVVRGLRGRNVTVIVHERPPTPSSWAEEADALTATIVASGHQRVAVVAGSNGCSVAMRVMLDRPELVARTMLCWPATAGDSVVDDLARVIISDVHDEAAAEALLAGRPLRGVDATELAQLDGEVVIYPSMPENKMHQRSTVMELLAVVRGAMLVGGSPEPIDDEFFEHCESFVSMVEAFSKVVHDD